jgi:hypothetical protein
VTRESSAMAGMASWSGRYSLKAFDKEMVAAPYVNESDDNKQTTPNFSTLLKLLTFILSPRAQPPIYSLTHRLTDASHQVPYDTRDKAAEPNRSIF